MPLNKLKISLILCSTLFISSAQCFHFITENREVMYEYVGQVMVGARASIDDDSITPTPPSGWKVRGTLKLQRRDDSTIAAALAVEKVILNNSGQVFYQNKEILPFYNPFKIVINQDVVSHLQFKDKDALWSINFKRAVASAFQVQGEGPGAFVVNEPSINGNCTTEYYISNKTDYLSVRKTPELNSCNKVGGIHFQRSNVPLNPCEFDFQCCVSDTYKRLAGFVENKNWNENIGKMFWNTEYTPSPHIDNLLSKEDVKIEELLDDDEIGLVLISMRVLEFIKTRDGFLQTIFNHFGTPAIMDLLFHIITNVEGADLKNNLFGWLKEQNLIPRMIDLLSTDDDSEKHNNISEFICEILSNSRSFRRNEIEEHGKIRPVEDISLTLLQVLEDEVTTRSLLDIILSNAQKESCVVAGIRIVMKLLELENSPKAIQPDETVLRAEKEYHDVYLASLLPIIASRIEEFHNLLINPPQKSDIRNTVELLSPPFGNTRLQICVMFAALLKENNSVFTQAICNSEFFNTLLKLFKQYCWNNLLHTQVLNCVCAVFPILSPYETITTDLPVSALQSHVVVNCKLVTKLIDCWMHNTSEVASPEEKKGRRLGYMGHLIDMLNNIVEISRNSTELVALLNSSMDAEEKANYETVLNEMDVQLVSQRRYLADIDPYTDPYQNLKDDHYTDYTNFDEPINDNKIRDEIQMQFSDSWIGESSLNHGSSGDYQDDQKISNDAWDWLSDSGQKSSANVNTNFDDFFADFESHFENPLSDDGDADDVNRFPLKDFNAKSDDFGPLCTFGVSDNNANLWTPIENQGQNCLAKEEQFSNSSFDDAVFDAQPSNTESQAINKSSVPVTNQVESALSDNINNSNDQQVPNTDTTTEYSQNTNKEEIAIQPDETVLRAEKEYHDVYLASLLPIIASRIEEFHNLLINPPQKSDIRNTVELLSPPFGNTRLQICVMFAALLKENNSVFTQAICNSEFFNTLLKLFKQYCWNNLLHTQVLNCVCAVFPILSPYETITTDLPVSALQSHVVVNCKLVTKLIDCWMHNTSEVASPEEKKGRRLGYMGHLIDMLNNIVEISRNSTELVALLNSSMDAEEKANYETVLNEMDVQLVSQRRYLADIDPYTDPYQNLKDDHYTDYTNFDEPINDNKIRDEIQMQFSDSWIGESSLNHGSSGDYQDDQKISNDAWDWLSDSGQKSSANVNTNFDDFFADFESHFENPLSDDGDADDVNRFPLKDFNAKSDDFGPLCTFGVSDNNANLWTPIENQGQNCLAKEEQFSNSSFDDAVFDAQPSNTESQAINKSSVPVTNQVESALSDNINNSNDQQVPNTDTTTEYSQNTNKEEISCNQPNDLQYSFVADLTTTLSNLSVNDLSDPSSPQDHQTA